MCFSKSVASLLFSSLFFIPSLTASADTKIKAQFDFESVFHAFYSFSATHELSQTTSLSGGLVTYIAVDSLELDFDAGFNWAGVFVTPGVGLTFGPASWGFSVEKRLIAARDIAPYLSLYYTNNWLELDHMTQFWLPIQESWTTAVGLGETRLWGALKWKGFGVGPFFNGFLTKEANSNFRFSHLRFGAVLVANIESASFRLFVGHDTISDAWLGSPKASGPYFRGTFIYYF